MNKREFLKEVFDHLAGMSERAVVMRPSGDMDCQYLTETGARCAIGHFIPDGHPGLQYEGAVEGLLQRHPDLEEFLEINDVDPETERLLWNATQAIHDDPCYWDDNGFMLDYHDFVATTTRIMANLTAGGW